LKERKAKNSETLRIGISQTDDQKE